VREYTMARKTIEIEKIREAVANYMRSEGCSCCEGHNHAKHREALAKLLDIPKYEDSSGYNFFQFSTEEKDHILVNEEEE